MNKKLLIVDDDDSSRMLLSEFLEDFDFAISSAESCKEAEAIIRSQTVDVAVLDMNLPDGTGTDLARIINETSPKARILLLSGNDTETSKKACEKAEVLVHGHLSKPFSLQGIADWVSEQ